MNERLFIEMWSVLPMSNHVTLPPRRGTNLGSPAHPSYLCFNVIDAWEIMVSPLLPGV